MGINITVGTLIIAVALGIACASRHEIMHKIEQPLGITWLPALFFFYLSGKQNGGKHLKKPILLLIDANEPCIDI